MTTERSIALVIEGIGNDTAYSAGIAWVYGRQTVVVPGSYEVQGGTGSQQGLAARPDSVAATVNPFDLSVSSSAFTFELKASDLAKRLLFARPIEPADSLSADAESDATTLSFSGSNYTWSASDDGTVVWVGDEAILLGSYGAGPQFTGCTRAYYSTLAGVQPNGMNVWRKNPFMRNRRAILVLHDHDAGTWAQVWQGFIDPPVMSGTIISVSARDLLSVIASGDVNRGEVKKLMAPSSIGSASGEMTGYIDWERTFRGFAKKRVNKANAVSTHWVAMQRADSLVYALYDSSTGHADFVDAGTTSLPQLGSESAVGGGDAYELLVVDRHKDVSANGAEAAYANMRSSTRNLQYPFHPVAISMALLTSGPSPDPGEKGSGAAGIVITASGTAGTLTAGGLTASVTTS